MSGESGSFPSVCESISSELADPGQVNSRIRGEHREEGRVGESRVAGPRWERFRDGRVESSGSKRESLAHGRVVTERERQKEAGQEQVHNKGKLVLCAYFLCVVVCISVQRRTLLSLSLSLYISLSISLYL